MGSFPASWPACGAASWAADSQQGSGAGWAHPAAVRALDFKNNRYMREGVQYAFADLASVTRAGTGWLDSIGGIWSEFLANVLRRTDRGAAIGGQFTNKIRNPRGEGGVVGTVGVTNKCTGYNAAPPALVTMGAAAAFNSAVTNMTASGGDGSTLFGVVDDAAALTTLAATDPFIAAGLANGWLNGRVFKIDNSASASVAALTTGGTTGNTNKHSASMYMRVTLGTGQLVLNAGGSPVNATSATYARLLSENVTPTGSGNNVQGKVLANSVAYFILFDLIEAATAAPVPTVVAGAAATGALPTNWLPGSTYAAGTGINTLFLGVGTKNGRPYADVTLAGTAIGTGGFLTAFEGAAYAAALAGQAWGADAGIELIAGAAPSGCLFGVVGRTSGGSNPESLYSAAFTPAGLAQISGKGVLSGSTTVYVQPALRFPYTNGVTYNMGLRIYAPKLVQLAVIEGPELVTNGDFASATGWSVSGGWSISAGKLNSVPATFDYAEQSGVTLTVGAVYKLIADVVGNAGSAIPYLYGGQVSPSLSASGTQIRYGVAGGSTGQGLRLGQSTFDGSLDNVSLKLVTPGYMPGFPILPPLGVPGGSTKLVDDVRDTSAMEGAEVYDKLTLFVPSGYVNAIDSSSSSGFATSGGASTTRVAYLAQTVVGQAYRIVFGALPAYVTAYVRDDVLAVGTIIATANSGATYVDFVATQTMHSVLFSGAPGSSGAFTITGLSHKRLTPFAGWLDASLDNGFTVLATINLTHVGDGAIRTLFSVGDGTPTNRCVCTISTADRLQIQMVVGGAVLINSALVLPVSTGRTAFAITYKSGAFYLVANNGLGDVAAATVVALPPMSQNQMGGFNGAGMLNDIIEQIQVCRPLPQAEAQAWALAA